MVTSPLPRASCCPMRPCVPLSRRRVYAQTAPVTGRTVTATSPLPRTAACSDGTSYPLLLFPTGQPVTLKLNLSESLCAVPSALQVGHLQAL